MRLNIIRHTLFVLYIITVVALAFVKSHNSCYMIMLWGMLATVGVAYILHRKQSIGVYILHMSFLLILVGALTTHLTQRKGNLHLRQGETTHYCIDENGMTFKFPFQLQLDSFKIEYERDNAKKIKDYISYVTVLPVGNHYSVSMNNILKHNNIRFYQESFDKDEHGTSFIVNYDPYGIPITYCGYIFMGIGFVIILVKGRYRRMLPMAAVLTSFIAFLFSQKEYDIPVLNTWLLPIHVSLIIAAYIMLVMAVWKRDLLPIALAFLAIGIFVGAYWANISWGTYWSWDPKEVWALITLMVYAVPLHKASLPIFQSNRFYRIYMLIASLTILMTYFGVNLLLGGLHSYYS